MPIVWSVAFWGLIELAPTWLAKGVTFTIWAVLVSVPRRRNTGDAADEG